VTAVGIVAHPGRPRAVDMARSLTKRLTEAGIEVRIPGADADALDLADHGVEPDAFPAGLDFAVSLGGDGTMLRTVDLVYRSRVPVMGVNLGQLGFLTGVEPDEVDSAVDRVLGGDYQVEERMVLRVSVESERPAGGPWWALNECVLEKAHPGRLVRLAVSLAGERFTTYAADGIIVATPTGSTAYAFSARGPIISPGLSCLLVTPVSPHMLFDRSLVLGADEAVGFEVIGDSAVELTVDGRTLGELDVGDRVVCEAAEAPARLIVFSPRDFHHMLKVKFGLADR